jgi:glycine/serine hydroxymethyltransferase
MSRIADWIARVLEAPRDAQKLDVVRHEVRELASSFPLFHELVGT